MASEKQAYYFVLNSYQAVPVQGVLDSFREWKTDRKWNDGENVGMDNSGIIYLNRIEFVGLEAAGEI